MVVETPPLFNIMCVSKQTYGYRKSESFYRLPALKGRPRYRLRDTWATYNITISFAFTNDQYEQFLNFWYNDISAGLDPFLIRLMMDDAVFYKDNDELYQVHATSTFNANAVSFNLWSVQIPIQVAGGFRTNLFDCPIIYGGPIDSLAVDVIYAGTPSSPSEDIIVPCPGIDPND